MHFKQHCFVGSKAEKLGWWAVWCACVWSIWLARNKTVFQNVEINARAVFEDVKYRSWSWLRTHYKGFAFSIFERHLNPFMCIVGAG